jgi:hypothetical protein
MRILLADGSQVTCGYSPSHLHVLTNSMSDPQPEPPAKPQAATPSTPQEPLWRRALDNPWLMLGMLFFVTAALGLPFLWMSRGFSLWGKVVVSVLVIAWTVLILWLFWLVMVWSYTRIVDAL